MIAHFNNIEKDWRSKAEGRKWADRMCNNCVGQPGCWSWLSSMFFYSTSKNPYMRKTSPLETVPGGCCCFRMLKTPYFVYILDVVYNKFQNVQLGFVWFVAMSKGFNA